MTDSVGEGGGARILIVEDDVDTLWLLARACQIAGHQTTEVISGTEALREVESSSYDILLLDLGLPDMDGIELLTKVADRRPNLYVIILTASPSLESAVAALRLGAINYIQKPVATRAVLTAVRDALVRRARRRQELIDLSGVGDQVIGPGADPHQRTPKRTAQRFETRSGSVIFEPNKQQVMVNSELVSLTRGETEVLGVLLAHLDQAVSPQNIAVAAWGESMETVNAENIIRPHIYRLRQKIESEPSSPRTIITVRGKGYMIPGASPRP